jgi:hypothetical protein
VACAVTSWVALPDNAAAAVNWEAPPRVGELPLTVTELAVGVGPPGVSGPEEAGFPPHPARRTTGNAIETCRNAVVIRARSLHLVAAAWTMVV